MTALNQLADAYAKLKKLEEALEIKEKVYLTRLKLLGEEHPDTLKTLSSLAHLDRSLGNHEKAYENMKTAYHLYRKVFGKNHTDTVQCKKDLEEFRKDISFFRQIFKP